jgi:alginate O-acetyltransferase complex protein AlgI
VANPEQILQMMLSWLSVFDVESLGGFLQIFFSQKNLEKLVFFNEETPLIFTRFFFWGFFAVVMVLFSVLHKKIWMRNCFLFFASIFFYYKTSGLFVLILLFSTLSDYLLGFGIYKASNKKFKLSLAALSVAINLFVLAYFKYAYFFTDAYNELFSTNLQVFNHFAQFSNSTFGTGYDINNILLPVGISFFTFQTISYSIDIYRGRIKPVNSILDFGFYVSFFPQLVAGPIVRANEFVPQLYKAYDVTKKEFGGAVFLILNGMFKKLVLGDYIAVNFIDRIFDNPLFYTGFENLMALFAYSLQVYADFSGYTDIAIGVALLMGFRLPLNFNSPYKAKNVAEFWKRWHISLSTWLKDYLYIPLGGNRNASAFTWICSILIVSVMALLTENIFLKVAIIGISSILGFVILISPKFKAWLVTNINLMITMLLGGLWHGASWQFIIWGGLNGLGLVVYKNWRKISPWENSNNFLVHCWKVLFTFSFITFTRIWFRSDTMETSMNILRQIAFNFQPGLALQIIQSYSTVFMIMAGGLIIHWLPSNWKQLAIEKFSVAPAYVQAGTSAIVIFLAYQAVTAGLQPFIYFQF